MKRSKHSLSYKKLLSSDMGELVPIGLTEVLPGDSIQHATSLLLRASPMLAPVMHPVDVRIHHWFVPHRLSWTEWEDFITGGPNGTSLPAFPTITIGGGSGAAVGSLADYLGVPTGVNNIEVSALPFRAYAQIWNQWYRDQDLETPLVFSKASGADTTTNTLLKNCAWEKDYFTSARPWEQKGPTVTIPIAGQAPVSGIYLTTGSGSATNIANKIGVTAALDVAASTPTWDTKLIDAHIAAQTIGAANATTNRPQVFADLSAVSGVSVNNLREALALQRYEEARARFGSRYVEYLRYLGVRSSDARLQLPEYLGGGRQTVQFSEVLQTAADASNPVGTMRGHGIAAMRSNRYRRFFEEHGYVVTMMSVRPKTVYMQGLFRHWNRRTKEDFWQQELQHVGQQEILNKELYAAHASPNGIFGYQDRYDEYRRAESLVSGEFRTTLNFWHMARDFGSTPALNGTFVSCAPTERIFAVPSTDNLWVMANHSIQARRLVSPKGNSFIY
ncbi:MAG: major capsid protein [Arizlama microvirus]|nr:MAG: major capsid protein [Arizlama microvirus]